MKKLSPTKALGARIDAQSAPSATMSTQLREPVQCVGIEFPVVGIGASTGGVEAFTALLKALPPNSGMAFVMIMHLDATPPSQLVELVSSSAPLPVTEVIDGLAVMPDQIYVCSANANVTLVRGRLRTMPQDLDTAGSRAIDGFFCSLAEERHNAAIGVLLSGTGQDGGRGMRAIKAAGGITLAESAESAKFVQMPVNARMTGGVDLSLPPERIGEEVARIGEHPYLRSNQQMVRADTHPESNEEVLREICQILRNSSGIDFHLYKPGTVQRRVERRMALRRCATPESYLEVLRGSAAEAFALSEDILIHSTGFFRDAEALMALQETVFRSAAWRDYRTKPMRIWSAGCSSGEEVYSIAIMLLEELGGEASYADIKIFGTDISEIAIKKARAGIYPEWSLEDVSAERRKRFFVRTEGGYQIAQFVRDICLFTTHDVTKDPPFSRLGLISCRNLMIYLGPLLQRRVIETFHYALNPGGFLWLGKPETLTAHSGLFSMEDPTHKIFKSKISGPPPPKSLSSRPASIARTKYVLPPAGPLTFDLRKEVERLVMNRYGPAALVVGPDLHVVHFHGEVAGFLSPGPGEPSFNLLKLIRRELVVDLHRAFHEVRTKRMDVDLPGIRLETNGREQTFDIKLSLFSGRHPKVDDVLIVFQRGAEPAKAEKTAVQRALRRGSSSKVAKLERELAATRQHLVATIHEHEATNEEMRALTQDALSSNKELQTTNEELEAAKEELQSSYEELVTTNDELQHRNTELSLLTADLNTLLEGIELPIIILDSELRTQRFTPEAGRIFNLINADVGRPFSQLASTIEVPEWESNVHEVTQRLRSIEREVEDHNGHWYSLRLKPFRCHPGAIPGMLIVLLDIQDAKSSLREAREAQALAELATRAKADFLSAMSHEIRTPMNGIIGMTGLLLGTPLTSDQREYAEAVQDSSQGLLAIINDILDFSKGEAGKLELESLPFDLRSALEDVVNLLAFKADEKGLEMVLSYPANIPSLFTGDVGRVRQIFMNLLGNAIKFTKVGYVFVEVSASRRDADELDVHIAVHDTGIGIAEDQVPRLFDKFTQIDASHGRRYGGTGLGLAISKQLAELLGGRIAVSTLPGQGSTFIVTLPLTQGPVRPVSADTSALRGVRCLVVDGHAMTRFVTSDLCGAWGMRTKEAQSLAEALEKIEKAHAGNESFQVVLVDYALLGANPEGSLKTLRALPGCAQLRVISLKLLHHHRATQEQEAGPFEITLIKPLRPSALLEALISIFGSTVEPEVQALPPAAPALKPQPLAGLRVLVVEDNILNQKVTAAQLRKLGCCIDIASNGVEALRMSSQVRFDLILMDCQMPELDGLEATRRIREREHAGKQTPIVALTAGVLESDRQNCLEAGMDDFIAKPTNSAKLLETISKWTGGRSGAG